MNAELIPINRSRIGGEETDTVNARDLHTFLESKQHFADWIKNRIREYGFQQDSDYTVYHNFMINPEAVGRPSNEYHLTIDMAKELCMVERNERGREARRYFIACERRMKALQSAPPVPPRPVPVPADPAMLVELLNLYRHRTAELDSRLKRAMDDLAFFEYVCPWEEKMRLYNKKMRKHRRRRP